MASAGLCEDNKGLTVQKNQNQNKKCFLKGDEQTEPCFLSSDVVKSQDHPQWAKKQPSGREALLWCRELWVPSGPQELNKGIELDSRTSFLSVTNTLDCVLVAQSSIDT